MSRPRISDRNGSKHVIPTTEQSRASTTDEPTCEDFDDIIDRMGSNRRYQKLLLYFAIAPIVFISPILIYNSIFIFFTPDHWCTSSDRDLWDDVEEYKLVNIPMIEGKDGNYKYSSCKLYGQNSTVVECPYGWEFDKLDYEQTMVGQYGWVCDNKNVPTYAFLIGKIGNTIGILGFGLISDMWGRKSALFLAILTNVVYRFASLFVGRNLYVLYVVQFMNGSTLTSVYTLSILTAAEFYRKDDWGKVYSTVWIIYLSGLAALPFICWLCGNWFLIGIVTSSLGVAALFYYPFLPESPRWLLQKGRLDECVNILGKFRQWNVPDKPYSKLYLHQLLQQVLDKQKQSTCESQEKNKSKACFVLFCKWNLAKNTLILVMSYTTATVIYSGMTFHAMHMTGSHFKNFFLLAIIEVPSGIVGGYLADTIGRRWTQSLAFFLCATGCFSASLFVEQRELETLFAIFSKLTVTISFVTVFIQAAEIFPTELRSTGSSVASTVGNFVGILSPIITTLGANDAAIPWLVMGAISVVGGISALFMPETLNLGLPETIEEANTIGNNRKFWTSAKSNKTHHKKNTEVQN